MAKGSEEAKEAAKNGMPLAHGHKSEKKMPKHSKKHEGRHHSRGHKK